MKILFKLFFLILILLPFSTSAQKAKKSNTKKLNGYYTTYEDYVNNNLVEKDELATWYSVRGKFTLVFKKNGEKEKVSGSKIWGFRFKGELFRIDNVIEDPARVISIGNIVYYENGFAHLQMLDQNTDKGNFAMGYFCFISNDLNSQMTPLPQAKNSETKTLFKKFKAQNSQHSELYDCIGDGTSYDNHRKCVSMYIEKNEEEDN